MEKVAIYVTPDEYFDVVLDRGETVHWWVEFEDIRGEAPNRRAAIRDAKKALKEAILSGRIKIDNPDDLLL